MLIGARAMMRLGILLSGRGSNFLAIAEAIREPARCSSVDAGKGGAA